MVLLGNEIYDNLKGYLALGKTEPFLTTIATVAICDDRSGSIIHSEIGDDLAVSIEFLSFFSSSAVLRFHIGIIIFFIIFSMHLFMVRIGGCS